MWDLILASICSATLRKDPINACNLDACIELPEEPALERSIRTLCHDQTLLLFPPSPDLSRKTTPPTSDHASNTSSLVSSSTKAEPLGAASVEVNRHRSRLISDELDGFVSYPPLSGEGVTKEERAQSIAAPMAFMPEYKHIEKYNIVSVSGMASVCLSVRPSVCLFCFVGILFRRP